MTPSHAIQAAQDHGLGGIAEVIKNLRKELLYWKGVVRGSRVELHEAGRLSDDEYAHLCQDTEARDFVEQFDIARDERAQDVRFEDFRKRYLRWVAETFPGETVEARVTHLKEEVEELGQHPADPGELADCFMLILCIAYQQQVDILQAAEDKFTILKTREWELIPGRGYRHVKK